MAHRVELGLAGRILAAGHGHGPVPQELVGDVDARRDRRGDRQLPGMEEGPVAEVLHQVIGLDEGGHPDPLRALVAHAGEAGDVAVAGLVAQHHHRVAADPGAHQNPVLDHRAAVVGTARAEERRAGHRQRDALAGLVLLPEPVADAGGEPGPQGRDDVVGVQRAAAGDHRGLVLVGPPHDRGVVGGVVERVLHQRLDVGVLLLDDQNLLDLVGEGADRGDVERDGHAELEEADPGRLDLGQCRESESAQRLAHLAVGDTRRHDADPRVGRVGGHVVETVQRGVLEGQRGPHLEDLPLDLEGVRSEEGSVRNMDVRGPVDQRDLRGDPFGVELDRARAVGHVGHDLQPHPHAGGPAEGDGVAAEVEGLAGVTRVEHGDVHVGEHPGRRRRDRRGLGVRVVAHDRHRTAVGVGARVGGVPERIGGAIDTGPLAVPEADHAVVGGVGPGGRELAAHHRGGRVLLVDRRAQVDREVRGVGRRLAERAVEPTQGGARIARGDGGGPEPVDAVDPELLDREPGQCLETGHEHGARVLRVAVGQAVRVRRGHRRRVLLVIPRVMRACRVSGSRQYPTTFPPCVPRPINWPTSRRSGS